MAYTQTCRTREGFTLIEILIAIAIIAVGMAAVAPRFIGYLGLGQRRATETSLHALKSAIQTYYVATLEYPDKIRDLNRKPSREGAAKKWTGPYLDKELVQDGWGHPFKYEKKGKEGHSYELYSYGPNGKGAPKDEWVSVWDL